MATATQIPSRPTAPLSPAASAALHRLELRVMVPGAIEAAARYGVASFRTAQMSRWMDTRDLTDAEFDDFEFAQDTLRDARRFLADADLLYLIGGG